jgi:hypothetical protein
MMMFFMDMCGQSSAMFNQRPLHFTVFEHVGDMIPDISYLHVVVPVAINKFENMFARAMTLLMDYTSKELKSRKFSDQEWYTPKSTKQHDAFINPIFTIN